VLVHVHKFVSEGSSGFWQLRKAKGSEIMKRISLLLWPLLFVLAWIGGGVQTAQAATNTFKVVVNGSELQSDVPPQIISSRTMVPLSALGSAYGVTVAWDKNTGIVTVTGSNGKEIKLQNAQHTAYVNGQAVWMDVAPTIINNRMFLPFRQMGDFLGATVGFESSTHTVVVNKPVQMQVNGSKLDGANVYHLPAGNFASLNPLAKVLGYDVKTWNGKVILQQGTEKYTLSPCQGTYESTGFRNVDGQLVISPEYLSQLINGKTTWNEGNTICTLDNLQSITDIVKTDTGISIKTDGKMIEPVSYTMANPYRVVLDFSHAKMNVKNNNVTSSLIQAVRYSQTSESPYNARVVLDLFSPAAFHVTTLDGEVKVDLTTAIPAPVPTPAPAPVQAPTPTPSGHGKYKIIIDAGHGGSDSGAVGTAGNYEKVLTLSVASKVTADLRNNPNFNVIMTRTGDTLPGLQDRVDIANGANADLFLSIHANSAVPSAHGTETYYRTSQSSTLAAIMHKHLLAATGFFDRGVKTANYYVIKNTNMPSTLVELGFLTNSAENQTMLTPQFQQRVADALAAGITEYYNKYH
jgi:N-acetylmuramoyl-L-alanine amidase